MIEYLLEFDNEAAAKAALLDWLATDENGVERWSPKPQSGIMQVWPAIPATYDKKGDELTARVPTAGYYLTISLPERDDRLYRKAHTLSAHENRSKRMVELSSKSTDIRKTTGIVVEPVFAGSNY